MQQIEEETYYEELNWEWNFFGTPALRQFKDRVTQFVPPPLALPEQP